MISVAHMSEMGKVSTPFSAILSFETPTTELDASITPSTLFCAGKFETFDDAKAACIAFGNHPALIAMQVRQLPEKVRMESYSGRFFESNLPQDFNAFGVMQ